MRRHPQSTFPAIRQISAVLFVALAALLLAKPLAAQPVKGDPDKAPFHPTRILVKLKEGEPKIAQQPVLRQHGLKVRHQFKALERLAVLDLEDDAEVKATKALAPEVRARRLQERMTALRATGRFEYVEPDYIRTLDGVPSDTAFADGTLWALRNTGQNNDVAGADIGAVAAWDITTGSNDVIVAVVDTGIRYTHQDLAANIWRNPGESGGGKETNGIDDDGDGYIDNVHGINPWSPDRAKLPQLSRDASGNLIFRFRRSTSATGTDYAILNSTTLQPGSWRPLTGVPVTTTDLGNGIQELSITVRVTGEQRFFRLQVTQAEPLQAWRQAHFGSPANSGDGADLNDCDRDGLPNIVEFACGLDPKTTSAGRLPQGRMLGDNLVISLAQPVGVSGITYGAEWSATLRPGTWTAVADTGTSPQHTFSVSSDTRPKLFIRDFRAPPDLWDQGPGIAWPTEIQREDDQTLVLESTPKKTEPSHSKNSAAGKKDHALCRFPLATGERVPIFALEKISHESTDHAKFLP
ncbi:MAG: hypothetical protein NTW21_21050 [Verrucomicrobia bacterium]|nr:hypothetical protein [Verrucomicrobiota bacterium]